MDNYTDIENQEYYKYRNTLYNYVIFISYGFFGGIIINLISDIKVFNFDMFFNLLISPFIYRISPKKILTRIGFSKFIKFYTIPFGIGLLFRFLDRISILSTFILNPAFIKTDIQISLVVLLSTGLFLIAVYYLYNSKNKCVNVCIFLIVLIFTVTILLSYIKMGGNVYVHHYFLGLVVMLVSLNHTSNLTLVLHSLGYAIYIEGISKWGFAKLYWSENDNF